MTEYIILDDFLPDEEISEAEAQGYLRELIRCKDCTFYYEGENEVDYWMRCRLHSINTDSDNFCSWAVKKQCV